MPANYDWVTDEMFDAKLRELAAEMDLLSIPGVYELVSEELNNDVLEALEAEREPEDDDEAEPAAEPKLQPRLGARHCVTCVHNDKPEPGACALLEVGTPIDKRRSADAWCDEHYNNYEQCAVPDAPDCPEWGDSDNG